MNLLEINFSELLSKLTDSVKKADNTVLAALKLEWLGKDGKIKELFKQLRDVSAERKPAVASGLNEFKGSVEFLIESREKSFAQGLLIDKLRAEFLDPTLPAKTTGFGNLHPVTKIERQISELLRPFGFENVLGPDVETEYFCFDSLNIPPHHPARDMQDTFYTETGHVLRTHTTSVQSRSLQKGGSPLKVASFGKVFRNETEDASHQAMFHQFELVWIQEGLTLSHLMGLITHILKSLYGKRRKVRFVPKFYPYTEPSIGPQINCSICNGNGCPSCGGSGWVTVAGAGMVHRKVLEEFNYDSKKISGFAFGMGTSRLAGQLFDVPKLKSLYDNDLRILRNV